MSALKINTTIIEELIDAYGGCKIVKNILAYLIGDDEL